MIPKILDMKTVFKGWATLRIATIRFAGEQVAERLIEDHGRAVCVLPYDPQRKTAMLVRQFRAPVYTTVGRTDLLEAVAGLLEDETPADAAAREAFEETGLKLQQMDHVATVWAMPGISTERMDLFLARYAQSDRIGEGGGHASEHENITVVELPLAELAAMADGGLIDDMKTLALLQTLRLREQALFEK
jgi:nudix-type nucleoside diphosphatase (YffH/AdpP family)